jgi:hypothetical protein
MHPTPDPTIHGARPLAAHLLLSACALVATAYLLGAAWLATPLLGAPLGLWLIVVAVGVLRLDARAAFRRLTGLSSAGDSGAGVWALAAMACRVFEALTRWTRPLRERFDLLNGSGQKCASRLSAWHDRLAWPERPLRIGLSLPLELADALRAAPGSSLVQWVDTKIGSSPESACKSLALDAVVHAEPGLGLRITTLERFGRDAAWHDWSTPRPLTYASVFPFLIDPTMVTLGIGSVTPGATAELARALAEAAAALSRSSHRIGLADRLIGRRPTDRAWPRNSAEPTRLDRTLLRLCRAFESCAERADATLATICARAISADLCAGAGRSWASERVWNLLIKVAGEEPEVALREAAWRFINLEDRLGFDGIARADRALRARPSARTIDHTVLLEWELEHGSGSDQAVGRLAAGICLACAGRDPYAIACVRDDLLEDMARSAWLVGRDQDRALLVEVFRHVERLRHTSGSVSDRSAA